MATSRSSGRRFDSPPTVSVDDEPPPVTAELARAIVLRSLNQAPRTRKQLADLLAKREVAPDVSDAVLDRFEEVGLVNDLEFAENWVRSRHAMRGLSRKVLRQELWQRGVGEADIEVALEQIDRESEYAVALTLASKKLRSLDRYDDASQRRRLMGVLMRRGHSSAVAGAVVAEVMSSDADAFESSV